MNAKERETAEKIAFAVRESGGRTYYVGGCVRDSFLELPCKDIDIEVHGITEERLRTILEALGEPVKVGRSFGVYKLGSIDIALPRSERSNGEGHKEFDVTVNPFIGEKEASRRRDFTFNALMKDVLTGEFVDFWNGIPDLKKGIIRHIDDNSFVEDPLRVLRAARFSAKLGFSIAPETENLCRNISLSSLSSERVYWETVSALLTDTPSLFFNSLRIMGQLDIWFPELKDLIGVPQNRKYHLEGDAWTHTMLVIDEAAKKRENTSNPVAFMFSALCHDLGKALVTVKGADGEFHAYKHEIMGVPVAERFMKRLTKEKRLIEYVLNMVRLHQEPNRKANANSSMKSTNKMFDGSVSPEDLLTLSSCDSLGKVPSSDSNKDFLENRLALFEETMGKPYVRGIDLVNAGLTPDKSFSDILAYAHKMRLAGVDKTTALKSCLSYAGATRKKA